MDDERLDMAVHEIRVGDRQNGYREVTLATDRGDVACRHYEVSGARWAAIWVGGAGGGWDTPAHGLYPRLCEELTGEGIASLRVRFRYPADLGESSLDVLAGLAYLQREGIEGVALTGHSFGGAVVIQVAAAVGETARTVVTLATQSYGAAPVTDLAPDCSILLLHGTADEVLPPSASEHVHWLAHEPKRLILYPGAGHVLGEVADEVHGVVRDWIVGSLSGEPSE